MNTFDQKLKETTSYYPLKADKIIILIANMGYKCNLRCTHCFVDASPERTEMMSLDTINKILDILRKNNEISTLELSGGAPEMNPHFRYFVKSAADMGKTVFLATNLVVFHEPGMEDLPEFLVENRVKIFPSLPSYSEEDVDRQRGKGTYRKVISTLKKLNDLGYGKDGTGLELNILYNPPGASMVPTDIKMVENLYREKLKEMHGITFNNIIYLNNMPVGRLMKSISEDEFKTYMTELEDKFNPRTIDTLMCRQMIDVSYDGQIHDCDFWQMLKLPLKSGNTSVDDFNYEELKNREIVTSPLCFVCTAAQGLEQLETWCGDV